MEISKYHFHIYFEESDIDNVNKVVEKLTDQSDIAIGRIHKGPVGPHPVGSCQITVIKENFEQMVTWFLSERMGLTIFIHPLTGDDYKDHSDHVIWIGKPYKINLEIFEPAKA